MPITATADSGTSFTPCPEGAHIAVCDQVINLGMQEVTWKNSTKIKHQIYIRFQIPAERIELEDKDMPMVVGRKFTLSWHEKASLRQFVESWRGKKMSGDEIKRFDIDNLLGQACQLSVVHNDTGQKVYANINAVMPLPKGVEAPKLEGEPLLFVDMNETPAAFDRLPNWVKEKIGADLRGPDVRPDTKDVQTESQKVEAAFNAAAGPEDDIPF